MNRHFPRPPPWLAPALLAVLFWGAWGLLSKVASVDLSPALIHVLSTAGAFCVVPFLVRGLPPEPARARKGMIVSAAAGILGSSGNILLYAALSRGGLASVVVPLTALYPVLTIALALLFLRERLWRDQLIGLVLAPAAILFLSMEPAPVDAAPGDASAQGPPERSWLWLSALSMLAYGASALLQKVATNLISPARSYLGFCYGYAITAAALLLAGGLGLAILGFEALTVKASATGLAGGVLNGLGVLCLFASLGRGKASVVVPFTALYPLLTLALAVTFLREKPSTAQYAGALLAVASGALLAREKPADVRAPPIMHTE